MNLKFLIDGSDYGNPLDWDSTAITMERVKSLNAIYVKYDLPTTFDGAGYDYIVSAFDADYTASLTLAIQYRCSPMDAFSTIWEGTIKLRDCEINRHLKLVQVKAQEQSIKSLINNNKSVKAYVDVARSKNDTAIVAVSASNIRYYDPATYPVSYTYTRSSYSLYNVWQFIIQFVSDGAVTFDSELLKTNGHWETTYGTTLYLTTGGLLRNASDGEPPEVSINSLFTATNQLIGVGFYVDNANSTVYLEALDESVGGSDAIFATGTTTATIRNIRELVEYIDTAKLYASVKIGSEITQRTESGSYQWPDYRYFNFKEEEYNFAGQSNDDIQLDLVNPWVIDSNVFEDVLTNSNDEYDKDIFIVEVEQGTTNAADFDVFNVGGAPLVYNKNLTNQEVLPRHVGGVPADATLYLGSTTDDFRAEKTVTDAKTTTFIYTAVNYDDESTPPNFDTGNNYDNVTNFDYVAPADGHYEFEATLEITNLVVSAQFPSIDIDIELRRDGVAFASTSLASVTALDTTIQVNGWTYLDGPTPGPANAVTVWAQITRNGPGPGSFSYDVSGGYFKTLNQSNGGGIYGDFDQNDSRINLFKWSKAMSFDTFNTIINAPRDQIKFNCGDDTANDYLGWVDKITYNLGQGKADVILRTSNNDKG